MFSPADSNILAVAGYADGALLYDIRRPKRYKYLLTLTFIVKQSFYSFTNIFFPKHFTAVYIPYHALEALDLMVQGPVCFSNNARVHPS